MSKDKSGAKTAGKIFTCLMIIVFICVLAVSWFINGQTGVIEKYCAALAMGSRGDYEKTVSIYRENGYSLADDFKTDCRCRFTALPEFAELEDTDSISSKVKVTEHRMNGSPESWVCTADIDFFGGGHSISRKNVSFTLKFVQGRWIITETEPYILPPSIH